MTDVWIILSHVGAQKGHLSSTSAGRILLLYLSTLVCVHIATPRYVYKVAKSTSVVFAHSGDPAKTYGFRLMGEWRPGTESYRAA